MHCHWRLNDKLMVNAVKANHLLTSMELFNLCLQFWSEVSNQTLHRPGGGITKCANSVSFNLARQFLNLINFLDASVSTFKSCVTPKNLGKHSIPVHHV